MNKLKERIKKLLTGTILIIGLVFMSGCNKESFEGGTFPDNKQQIEMVTQSFSVTTQIKDIRTKGFDPSTWIVQYNPEPFTMILKNTKEPVYTYTKEVTVNDLKNGLVTFSIVPGNYDITYTTEHGKTVSGNFVMTDNKLPTNFLDIKVVNNQNLTGTPVQLTATLEDGLIILDMNVTQTTLTNTGLSVNMFNGDGFKYGYFKTFTSPMEIILSDGGVKNLVINPFTLGKIYWVTRPFNGTIELTIPGLETERIILP